MVEWNHVEGPLSRVESTLRRKVGAYGRHYYSIYMGATSDHQNFVIDLSFVPREWDGSVDGYHHKAVLRARGSDMQ